MKLEELLKLTEARQEQLRFTHAEILKMHAVATLMDGRTAMAKFLKKHFTPAAMYLFDQYPEYKQ